MALLDVGMAILANQAAGFLATGVAPTRQGNSHPSLAPYQDFPTQDGSMLLAIGNDGQFARFCAAAGKPEWAARRTLCQQHAARAAPRGPDSAMEAVTRTRPTADWIALLLEDKAVPCGPINTIAQAFDDAQVQARGLAVPLPRWKAGRRATAWRRSPAWPARCVCQTTRPCCATPRLRWASTPMKCCRSWGWTLRALPPCAPAACCRPDAAPARRAVGTPLP